MTPTGDDVLTANASKTMLKIHKLSFFLRTRNVLLCDTRWLEAPCIIRVLLCVLRTTCERQLSPWDATKNWQLAVALRLSRFICILRFWSFFFGVFVFSAHTAGLCSRSRDSAVSRTSLSEASTGVRRTGGLCSPGSDPQWLLCWWDNDIDGNFKSSFFSFFFLQNKSQFSPQIVDIHVIFVCLLCSSSLLNLFVIRVTPRIIWSVFQAWRDYWPLILMLLNARDLPWVGEHCAKSRFPSSASSLLHCQKVWRGKDEF